MANNSYSAGSLDLSIMTIADDTLKKLDLLIERLSYIEESLKHIKGSSRGISKGSSSSKKDGNNLFGLAKTGATLHMMRRLGRFMGDLVQAGSDYNETLNLWQVAMRNNLDVADQFINKMQKAYGISSKTLMNAQATFKNMIGSLGQISDATAYALSEALVQMSADYASLYNRTFESALQNMQSMLAGQVRPIRSAGLDITETTLYQFYQQLGGTKSMRQLNRTEKQLLSILAVYQQMGSAGALGDMTKTLNQFANQSRMMREYWVELKTWSGLLLKDLIDDWGLLVKINALLITVTEVVKAIAKTRGLGEENYLTGLFETTTATNDEIDELNGKLLDFDKFRSLEGQTASPLAIDEKLLEAITGYSSKIDQAQNAAQKLAEEWLSIFGFTKDANGELVITESKLDNISDVFKTIGISVGIIVGYKFASWLYAVGTSATSASKAMGLLNFAIIGGIVYSVLKAIDAFRDGEYWVGILATAIGVVLVGAFLKAKSAAWGITVNLKTFYSTIGILTVGITLLYSGIKSLSNAWGDMGGWHKALTIIGAVTAALIGAYIAIKAFSATPIVAIGLGAALAGGVLLVSSQFTKDNAKIPNYENGASDIDSGTVFRAGEFGKTEAVYTGSNGKTNVANIQQMKAAELQALNEWWSKAKNDIPAFQGVSDSGLYTIVDGEAKRRGKTFAKV
jgi:hypothetical protein